SSAWAVQPNSGRLRTVETTCFENHPGRSPPCADPPLRSGDAPAFPESRRPESRPSTAAASTSVLVIAMTIDPWLRTHERFAASSASRLTALDAWKARPSV